MVRYLRRRSCALTDVGRRRPGNEDAFLADDTLGLYVVADGVGGQAKGEVASAESVEHVRNFILSSYSTIEAYFAKEGSDEGVYALRRMVESAVQSACYMVYGMAELDPEGHGMATTVSMMLIAGNLGILGQVGDSRIYRLRNSTAAQLTEDHTLVQQKLKAGLVTPEQAKTMKGRNVITRAVGSRDYVQVDTFNFEVEAGDRYLLCSDGFHGYLKNGELELLLGEYRVEDAARRAIGLANERGGGDNITVITIAIT